MTVNVTDNRNLSTPVTGTESGTWGNVLNSGVMAQLDLILGATQPITINSSDVSLSIPQWNNVAINLTGVLTGNRNLVLPLNANSATVAVGGLFVVQNNTTGAFNVTVKTIASGSTGVTVAQGKRALLYSDTVNVWNADDAKLQIIPFAGNPNGFVAGTAASVNNPPSVVWDYTNAQQYFCTTTGVAAVAVWSQSLSPVNRGFDTAVNLQISATHTGGNLLSVAIKTLAGTDPTILSPIIVPFQVVSGTATTGSVATLNITSALSMTTNSIGASLGATNSVPFRIWFALFNNSGTAVLAMRNCSNETTVFSLAEYGVASTTGVSGAATSAGVWYTPNGVSLANCAFRIIGYCDYNGGLITAGTYTIDPTGTVVFGPGIKKPGDIVQVQSGLSVTPGTTTSSVYAALGPTLSISLTSAANVVRVSAVGGAAVNVTVLAYIQLARGASLIGFPIGVIPTSTNTSSSVALIVFDRPNTVSSTTYGFQGKTAAGTLTYPASDSGSYLQLEELMG